MPKTKPTTTIDPRSDAIVLRYVGPGFVPGVPADDLHGGALARVAYHRRFVTAVEAREPRPADDAGFDAVDAIADELVASGFYTRDQTAPATAAATPEA